MTFLGTMRGTMLAGAMFLTGVALLASGCDSMEKQGISYEMGTLTAKVPATYGSAVTATRSALEDYGVAVQDTRAGDTQTVFEGTSASDQPVTVRVNQLSADQTEIKLSTDVFGDRKKSLDLLKKIYDNLNLKMP